MSVVHTFSVNKPTPYSVASTLSFLKLPGAADHNPVWANRAGRLFVILTRDIRLSLEERVEIAEWVLVGQYPSNKKVPGLAFHHIATSPRTHPDLISWSLSLIIDLVERSKERGQEIYYDIAPLYQVLIRDIILQQKRLRGEDFNLLYNFLHPILVGTVNESLVALMAGRTDCPPELIARMCLSSSRRIRYAASSNEACATEWRTATALVP